MKLHGFSNHHVFLSCQFSRKMVQLLDIFFLCHLQSIRKPFYFSIREEMEKLTRLNLEKSFDLLD